MIREEIMSQQKDRVQEIFGRWSVKIIDESTLETLKTLIIPMLQSDMDLMGETKNEQ